MPIPETQLDTWSKQGSVTQSQNTYATIRGILEDKAAPYASKSYSIFLQGSYGNDTNIYADSDVDIVICTSSIYYDDTSALKPQELEAYKAKWSKGSFAYADFRKQVTSHLIAKLGTSVKPGNKAIFVQGNGTRRDADVLPAAEYRRYFSYGPQNTTDYAEGIVFWTDDGTQIVNYPKRHSANCTSKHQATDGWFKPSVRILKNMRNSMVDNGYLDEGTAPSYFLEGMLYNVPDENFDTSYSNTITNALNWISASDKEKLLCANEMYYLINPTSLVTWRIEKLNAFLAAAAQYWKDWHAR